MTRADATLTSVHPDSCVLGRIVWLLCNNKFITLPVNYWNVCNVHLHQAVLRAAPVWGMGISQKPQPLSSVLPWVIILPFRSSGVSS